MTSLALFLILSLKKTYKQAFKKLMWRCHFLLLYGRVVMGICNEKKEFIN